MDPQKGESPVNSDPSPPDPVSEPLAFSHQPVMIDEVVALVEPIPAGVFVDATLGGAGHATAILANRSDLNLIGIDQDPDARAAASSRLRPYADRVSVVAGRFDAMVDVLERYAADAEISGFLFDLGVSSPQLDRAERGFSFRGEGPLDMRMDTTGGLTAADVVNGYDEEALSRILRQYGDERFSSRIAAMIVAARPLATTRQLAAVVVDAIPAAARRTGGHPAKRTFQAIRIEVNDELGALRTALRVALDSLMPGGRVLVLTYHSGEDRIVKSAFRQRTAVDQPPGFPVEVEKPEFAIVRPAVRRPSGEEEQSNPRSRSARLRAIERMAA